MHLLFPRPLAAGSVLLLALWAAFPSFAQDGGAAHSPTSSQLCGRLSQRDGLRVLELWGTPEQAGYAQGYLLAESIVALFDGFVLDPKVVPHPGLYESYLIPTVQRQFRWDDAHIREMQAICNGVRDRLEPAARRSRKLDRELGLADLMVANALADWHGAFCSSFSAWGALTVDGRVLTARNLDFPSTPVMRESQHVVVRRSADDRRGWVAVSWPGAIGVYTAMNSDGVSIFMHDAGGLAPTESEGFVPRSLILREALEAARQDTFVDDVRRVLVQRRVMVGNNVHVSAPTAAVVFEFDGNPRDSGVTIRRPDEDALAAQAIWCTNHMCERRAVAGPDSDTWRRYETLESGLQAAATAATRLDVPAMLRLIDTVANKTTVHTVISDASAKTMHVRIPAFHERLVAFRVVDESR